MKQQCTEAISRFFNEKIAEGQGVAIENIPGHWITVALAGDHLKRRSLNWREQYPDISLCEFLKSLEGMEVHRHTAEGKSPVDFIRPRDAKEPAGVRTAKTVKAGNTAAVPVEAPHTAPAPTLDRDAILTALRALDGNYEGHAYAEFKALRRDFITTVKMENARLKAEFLAAGGAEENYTQLMDPCYDEVLAIMDRARSHFGVIPPAPAAPAEPRTAPRKPHPLDERITTPSLTITEIRDILAEMAKEPARFSRKQVSLLKFKLESALKAERKTLLDNFLAMGGTEETFVCPANPVAAQAEELALKLLEEIRAAAPAPAADDAARRPEMTADLRNKLRALFRSLADFNVSDNPAIPVDTLMREAKAAGLVPKELTVSQFSNNYVTPSRCFEREPDDWRQVRLKFDPLADLLSFIFFGFDKNGSLINTHLQKLRRMALPENWSHFPEPNGIDILQHYFIHTVRRLRRQDKVATSINGEYAAFDTGLVDTRYQPIYCLLKRNTLTDKQPWIFMDFCIKAENNGTILVNEFTSLPDRASYFQPTDLVYDVKRGLPSLDYEHIIVEHAERLPRRVVEGVFISYGVTIPERTPDEPIETYGKRLGKAIRSNQGIHNTLVDMLDRVVKKAVMRTGWNYNTAIPMYYARPDALCLALPLCFTDENRADAALVVAKGAAGNYLGKTIYLPNWAYDAARVVGRTYSDWLTLRVARPQQHRPE